MIDFGISFYLLCLEQCWNTADSHTNLLNGSSLEVCILTVWILLLNEEAKKLLEIFHLRKCIEWFLLFSQMYSGGETKFIINSAANLVNFY